jgi:hypothetical protein
MGLSTCSSANPVTVRAMPRDPTGTGSAWLLVDGGVHPVTWVRPTVSSPYTFLDASEAEVGVAPGRNWVVHAPTGSVTITG